MFYSDGKGVVKFAKKTNPRILIAKTAKKQNTSWIPCLSFLPLRCEGDQKSKEFLPQRRKDREEAEYKSGFLVFLCALRVFTVRMLING
jgi:hypothetical protein